MATSIPQKTKKQKKPYFWGGGHKVSTSHNVTTIARPDGIPVASAGLTPTIVRHFQFHLVLVAASV